MTIAGELFEASKLNYWFNVQIDQIVVKSGCVEGRPLQEQPVVHYGP